MLFSHLTLLATLALSTYAANIPTSTAWTDTSVGVPKDFKVVGSE
jgi:hypothetical protein